MSRIPGRPLARRLSLAPALALALALALGCRGDAQQCEQGCRNFINLVFWDQADKEIAAAPVDQRDALRKQKLGELATKLDSGIDQCVRQCQSARDQTAIDCLIAAKTAEQARACSQ